MAATRLIALHINKGKTIAQTLNDRTDYAKNPEKTRKGDLVTGYECDPLTVDEEFMLSKRQYQQITGREPPHEVIAYQIRQSFKPGEVTPEEANRIGRETALRFTKGKYAFIVATHTDRPHIHNHIIFNSTSIDGTRKFKDFWFSALALRRVSDLVCLENGLSVIEPRRHGAHAEEISRGSADAGLLRSPDGSGNTDNNHSTDDSGNPGRVYVSKPIYTRYPRRRKIRDTICEDIDAILQNNPESFEEFLRKLQEMDYEIKYGKHISVRGKQQKNFIRLDSLEEGYSESDLRAHFLGQRKHTAKHRAHRQTSDARSFSLIIDIQKIMQTKGKYYQRWATVYNLKQMSKSLLYLREHNIDDLDQLAQLTAEKVARKNELLETIRQSEKRLTEIGSLKKNIIDYAKTREVYEAYRKAGYSKKFLEEHREEITIHKAAKEAFNQFGMKKIPKVRELSEEYAQVLEEKRKAYAEYREVKKEAQEMLIAKQNIGTLYTAVEEDAPESKRKNEIIH